MRTLLVPLAIALALPALAYADEQSPEDRLREALRQSVQEMRAAQDQAATAQASLAQAQQELAATKAQLDAANAKLAELQGKPAAKPEELQALQSQLRAAAAQNATLQSSLARTQSQVGQAQQEARARETETQRAAAGLKANTAALQTCKAANAKLIGVAEDILHLYQSESFRGLLLRSYEPVLGLAKVRLENTIQDYDDKIRDQEYIAK